MRIEEDTNINKITEEDIVIANSSVLNANGIISGNIYVEEGSTLLLYGTLHGNLQTEQNSSTHIYGTMDGEILSCKGKIELSGMLYTKVAVPDNVIKIKGCCINNTKF